MTGHTLPEPSCSDVRRDISARMDEAGAGDSSFGDVQTIERHVSSCPSCLDFEAMALRTRRALRFGDDAHANAADTEDTDHTADDMTARVLAAIEGGGRSQRRSRTSMIGSVVLFCIAIAAGFVATRWDAGVRPAVATDRSTLVIGGQVRVDALRARIVLTERRGDAGEPRRVEGSLSYVAPEALLLRLRERGSEAEVGVSGEMAWRTAGSTDVVAGREPFDGAQWSALELVVPVEAFGRDSGTVIETVLDGRPAVTVTTTVAQVDRLLTAVRSASAVLPRGDWRPLHPADHVMLWLDRSTGVPLRVEVTASADADRIAWSARQALDEPVGGPLFVLEMHAVDINAADVEAPSPPGGSRRDLGFIDREVAPSDLPQPSWLPDEMVAHRSGESSASGSGHLVLVRTWSNGRSWVKITGTHDWTAERLFGDIGPIVRPVATGAGTVYVSEDGTAVALHGADIDVLVTGSVAEADLVQIAASLGVDAREIPRWWDQAGARTADELVASGVPVLAPVDDRSGASIAFVVDDDRVEVSVAGPGARGMRIVQRPGGVLAPAEDPESRTVDVRGVTGRFSPGLGELTWVERDHVIVMSTRTLTLPELVVAAGSLAWVG